MNHVSSDEYLIQLANELQKVLSDCVMGYSIATDEPIERALRLKREITMMGALTKCQYILNVESGQIDTIVTIYKVKENLSSEDQKIYDDWFVKINGVKI
ncbi:hypothetical protein A2819_01200 [Candidatus Azambacteria bacterium RIFCSPHIGHO2_01_FULL_40_24]|uniref:Uncharacterized protein n=1 Tax=Candidatus Azambacteria bacterium RIFCSPHIGHO2_01_FULL_40_24 TaxID=1797301 RepID=A0A1F5B2B3_9BACT|nr:MAG: hypothetical protein A2819_01200 [Candidatus Azambacteria bacterium RIFCSPHIGHO2_01_FULL_40_24]